MVERSSNPFGIKGPPCRHSRHSPKPVLLPGVGSDETSEFMIAAGAFVMCIDVVVDSFVGNMLLFLVVYIDCSFSQ